MSVVTTAALSALLFGAAGWTGTLVAEALCRGRKPYADGPSPVAFARWPFALAGAAIGCALVAHGESPARLAVLDLIVLALAACCAADFSCGVLPDLVTLGPLALIVGIAAASHNWAPLLSAGVVFAPFAVAATISHGRAMGWGDAKLVALGGALLGAREATLAFTLAALAAYIIARRTSGLRRPIAFGPYLATSIVAMLAI